MQVILHPSAQRQGTGNGEAYIEPSMNARTLVVKVTQISINLLGSVTIKVQHSADGDEWFDVPGLTTTGLTATGTTNISVSPVFSLFDKIRLVWTFNNANSVTFYGALLGD